MERLHLHVFSRDPTVESVIWDSPTNGQAVMINQSPTSISTEQVTGDYRKISQYYIYLHPRIRIELLLPVLVI